MLGSYLPMFTQCHFSKILENKDNLPTKILVSWEMKKINYHKMKHIAVIKVSTFCLKGEKAEAT